MPIDLTEDTATDAERVNDLEHLLHEEVGPLPPITPDGGFAPAQAAGYDMEPIPAATPANFICLRGPCRYYFEPRTVFAAGNTRGTLAKPPIQVNRYCTLPRDPIDLTDESLCDCNRWWPQSKDDEEVVNRKFAIDNYIKEND